MSIPPDLDTLAKEKIALTQDFDKHVSFGKGTGLSRADSSSEDRRLLFTQ